MSKVPEEQLVLRFDSSFVELEPPQIGLNCLGQPLKKGKSSAIGATILTFPTGGKRQGETNTAPLLQRVLLRVSKF